MNINYKISTNHTESRAFGAAILNEPFVIFTGSGVITDQLERYKDELPFLTTIKKINRYYTLS